MHRVGEAISCAVFRANTQGNGLGGNVDKEEPGCGA